VTVGRSCETKKFRLFALAALSLLVGCAQEWNMVVTGPIKYSVLQINAKGRVILPGETDAAVTERYFFALPYFWQLDAINPDREAAIRTFIDYRGAAPVECAEGYRVAYHGLNEGGSTYAVLECVGRACARKVQEIL
jgi:hypothetical protein